jgi:hypothetical protein
MVRCVKLLGGLLLCGVGASAQQEAPKVEVNVEGFRYPPIAASARLQGDVLFEVSASGPKVVTAAHPVLTEAARKKTWTLPPLEGAKYLVRYHFVILSEAGYRPDRRRTRSFFLETFPCSDLKGEDRHL